MIYKNPERDVFSVNRLFQRNTSEGILTTGAIGDYSYGETEGSYGCKGLALQTHGDSDILLIAENNGYGGSSDGVLMIETLAGENLQVTVPQYRSVAVVLDTLYYKHMDGAHKGQILIDGFAVTLTAVAMP